MSDKQYMQDYALSKEGIAEVDYGRNTAPYRTYLFKEKGGDA